jgi:hypothetical protein
MRKDAPVVYFMYLGNSVERYYRALLDFSVKPAASDLTREHSANMKEM